MERRTNILPCTIEKDKNHITQKANDTDYGFYIGPIIHYVLEQTMLTVIELDLENIKQDLANEYTEHIMQDKRPLNNQNQAHGYWEVYYPDGTLHFKGLFVNSDVVGPYESYSESGSLVLKANFLNRIIYGFCEHLENKLYYAR